MRTKLFPAALFTTLALALTTIAAVAGSVDVFTLTSSAGVTYTTPSGAMQPMPGTALTVNVKAPGTLTIAFSARGTVKPSGSQVIPIVFIACKLDGANCQPGQVEFLFPQYCCDSRTFHWVAKDISKGTHKVEIFWGMGNPTMAVVTARTLIVQAYGP